MPNITPSGALRAALIAAALLTPSLARADQDERAAAAIAAAKARIQESAQRGEYRAGEIEIQAQEALDRAVKLQEKGDEDRAWHAANEASAKAELALATADLKAAQADRDKPSR